MAKLGMKQLCFSMEESFYIPEISSEFFFLWNEDELQWISSVYLNVTSLGLIPRRNLAAYSSGLDVVACKAL